LGTAVQDTAFANVGFRQPGVNGDGITLCTFPLPAIGTIPLDPNPLLSVSTSGTMPSVFLDFNGVLDSSGEETGILNIPDISNIPGLVGFLFNVAAVTYDSTSISYITNGKKMKLNP
jgi:hypothetical protein